MINSIIKEAKEAHLEWLKKAEDLINNLSRNSYAPINHTNCKFGQLILSKQFKNINEELKEEIDTIHFLLHDNYHQIYNLLVENKNPSNEDITNAKEFFEILKDISSALLESLDKINS